MKTAEGLDTYKMPKYQRANQSTCINHRPLVRVGDQVTVGQPLADGPSTDHGELALGQNLTVAYMPGEGFNYEDGIIVSERLVSEDLLTTNNISRSELDARLDTYKMPKYQRANQSTCINHRPLVRVGDQVTVGQPLADGPSTDHGELALGQNLTVAYMPGEGFNYEDGIIVSERLVSEDLLTTNNISRSELDARDTKLGPEEITREIPNQSEEMLANLDEDGIIRIGAEVGPGDILVGKVTRTASSASVPRSRPATSWLVRSLPRVSPR